MKTVMAIIQTILTFIGVAFIGLVFYSELSNPYNYVAASIAFIIGIYLSLKVFKMISRRGYIATITGDNATPELDNLKPIPGSGITELSALKLVEHFKQQSLVFSEYSIEIWGDFNAPKLKEKRKILDIDFNTDLYILNVSFDDTSHLQIKKPAIIHHSSGYLKIIKAKEVVWTFKNDLQEDQFQYINNGAEILAKSNTNWKPKREDLGIGMNAVYLQGY